MKGLLIFVAGALVGAVGTLIWLRKDIKKTMEERAMAQNQANSSKNDEDLPFTMGENGEKSSTVETEPDKIPINKPISKAETEKIEYNKLIDQTKNGTGDVIKPPITSSNSAYSPQIAPVPVLPRQETEDDFDDNNDSYDEESVIPRGEALFEIDRDDYDNNPDYEKKVLIYYAGDRVMATESGTKIENPSLFVGTQWEQFVGDYAENAAFVRNERVREDYMVQVEFGTYADEYGIEDY